MQTHVTLTQQEDIAYLTFACDEPGKPNTLDHQTLDELAAAIAQINAGAESLRAVILRSDSPRYFVVGANIEALKTLDEHTIGPWIEHGHAVFNALEDLPLPVIARVEGYCLGGGLELAMSCDLIIASPDARFGQPEARLGVVAGWGGTWRLPRRVGQAHAKELFFTGRIIEADEAQQIGLVEFVGKSAHIDAYLADLLSGIRQCSPSALAQMKRLTGDSLALSRRDAAAAETAASVACLRSADTRERLAAFFAKRAKT